MVYKEYNFEELDCKFRKRLILKIIPITFSSISDNSTSSSVSTTIPNGKQWLILDYYHDQPIANASTTIEFQGTLPLYGNLPLGSLNVFKFNMPFITTAISQINAKVTNNEGSSLSLDLYITVIEIDRGLLKEEGAISYFNELLKNR